MATANTLSSVEPDQPRRAFGSVRSRVKHRVDLVALSAAILVFGTGTLLLACFHMGEGSLRSSGFGLSRLVWVDIHRLSAAAWFVAVTVHGALHWRPLVVRLSRACKGLPGKASRADLALYLGFVASAVTASMAWFVVPGSPSLLGRVAVARLAPARHLWIDLHNRAGVILLPAVIVHVRNHLACMLRARGLRTINPAIERAVYTTGARHGSQQ